MKENGITGLTFGTIKFKPWAVKVNSEMEIYFLEFSWFLLSGVEWVFNKTLTLAPPLKAAITSFSPIIFKPDVGKYNEEVFLVYKLDQRAIIPKKGSISAAGFDLHTMEDFYIPPRGSFLVNTGLQMKVPRSCYGRIAPRSGLALRMVDVGAGVVDADFTGKVQVLLYNLGVTTIFFKAGDRIAQIILEKYASAQIVESPSLLDETERGARGFGSMDLGLFFGESKRTQYIMKKLNPFSTKGFSVITTRCAPTSDNEFDDEKGPHKIAKEQGKGTMDTPIPTIEEEDEEQAQNEMENLSQHLFDQELESKESDNEKTKTDFDNSKATVTETVDFTTVTRGKRRDKLTRFMDSIVINEKRKEIVKPKTAPVNDRFDIPYPSKILCSVGLFSQRLVLKPQLDVEDKGYPVPEMFMGSLISALKADNKPCTFLSLTDTSEAAPMCANTVSLPEQEKETYLKWFEHKKHPGWHVRIATSCESKTQLMKTSGRRVTNVLYENNLELFQPPISPPLTFSQTYRTFTDKEKFIKCGWLLFSPMKFPHIELRHILSLEMIFLHPEWIWFTRILDVELDDVETRSSEEYDWVKTPCWWITCPPLIAGEVDKILRIIFSRNRMDKPLCRDMMYISRDNKATPQEDWNARVLLEQTYYRLGERYKQSSMYDPCTIVKFEGKYGEARRVAMLCKELGIKPYFVAFNRWPTTPWLQPRAGKDQEAGGVLRSHFNHSFDFDRFLRDFYEISMEVSQDIQEEKEASKGDKDYEAKLVLNIASYVKETSKVFPALAFTEQRSKKRKNEG